jgi:hypothetical protein
MPVQTSFRVADHRVEASNNKHNKGRNNYTLSISIDACHDATGEEVRAPGCIEKSPG